eukprot:1388791-Alexandrium_andersonii.AAC.1
MASSPAPPGLRLGGRHGAPSSSWSFTSWQGGAGCGRPGGTVLHGWPGDTAPFGGVAPHGCPGPHGSDD